RFQVAHARIVRPDLAPRGPRPVLSHSEPPGICWTAHVCVSLAAFQDLSPRRQGKLEGKNLSRWFRIRITWSSAPAAKRRKNKAHGVGRGFEEHLEGRLIPMVPHPNHVEQHLSRKAAQE